MRQQPDFPEELCADEAVCFIAERHHVLPRQLLRHFLFGETLAGKEDRAGAATPLEANEIEILKGLSGMDKG